MHSIISPLKVLVLQRLLSLTQVGRLWLFGVNALSPEQFFVLNTNRPHQVIRAQTPDPSFRSGTGTGRPARTNPQAHCASTRDHTALLVPD